MASKNFGGFGFTPSADDEASPASSPALCCHPCFGADIVGVGASDLDNSPPRYGVSHLRQRGADTRNSELCGKHFLASALIYSFYPTTRRRLSSPRTRISLRSKPIAGTADARTPERGEKGGLGVAVSKNRASTFFDFLQKHATSSVLRNGARCAILERIPDPSVE